MIHNNYGWMLATCLDDEVRDGKAAMALARLALEKIGTPTAVVMDTVAASHAELGEFAKAAEAQRQAMNSDDFLPKDRAGAVERLKFYEAGRPWRDPPAGPKKE